MLYFFSPKLITMILIYSDQSHWTLFDINHAFVRYWLFIFRASCFNVFIVISPFHIRIKIIDIPIFHSLFFVYLQFFFFHPKFSINSDISINSTIMNYYTYFAKRQKTNNHDSKVNKTATIHVRILSKSK